MNNFDFMEFEYLDEASQLRQVNEYHTLCLQQMRHIRDFLQRRAIQLSQEYTELDRVRNRAETQYVNLNCDLQQHADVYRRMTSLPARQSFEMHDLDTTRMINTCREVGYHKEIGVNEARAVMEQAKAAAKQKYDEFFMVYNNLGFYTEWLDLCSANGNLLARRGWSSKVDQRGQGHYLTYAPQFWQLDLDKIYISRN